MLLKKTAPLVLLAVSALVLAGCTTTDEGGGGGDAEAPTELSVGVLTSLSGNSAFSGESYAQGRELAIEELTREGGLLEGIELNVVIGDDASDPNQAVTVVQRFAADEEIVAVIGGVVSQSVVAAAPIAERGSIPFLVVNAFAPTISGLGDFVFQVSGPTAEYNIEEAIRTAEEYDIKTVSIIYAQDVPTIVGFRNDFLKGFEEAGVKVVADAAGTVNGADYATLIRKAMAPDPDAVLLLFLGPQDGVITKQLGELGYGDVVRLGHVGDVAQGYIDAAGEYGPGIITNTGFFQDAEIPEVQEFMEKHLEAYGKPPGSTASPNGYQSFMIFGHAVRKLIDDGIEVNRDNIRKVMSELGTIPSVIGSSGEGEFGGATGRIFTYDGFIITLNEDKKWVEWNP